MTRWIPRKLSRYAISIRVKGITKEMAEDVFRRVLENHPVFGMQINRNGEQYAGKVSNVFHGRYHKFSIWKNREYVYMKMEINGVLGDNRSVYVLTNDIINAYLGKPLSHDDYWGYVRRYEQLKKEPHYLNSKEWLTKEFENVDIPVHPRIDRRCLETIFPPKAGLFEDDYSKEMTEIYEFMQSHHLSIDGLFALCTTLAIAEYCGSDEAALTWAYDGRETLEDQYIFGGLHRDVPFKIKVKGGMDEWRKDELIREARNQIRTGIAHSDYPYTLTAPYNKRWNNAVNVLRVTNIEKIMEFVPVPFEVVSAPKLRFAYALLDVEIVESVSTLHIRYRYSATHYKPESIQKFAALVRKYVEWLID